MAHHLCHFAALIFGTIAATVTVAAAWRFPTAPEALSPKALWPKSLWPNALWLQALCPQALWRKNLWTTGL